MRFPCPDCKKITRRDEERKYLPGTSRERRSSALVILRKRECQIKKCRHQFIIRTEYPLNNILEPTTTTSYNWAEYSNALKIKPGIPVGGTTYSEYTLMAGQDTEQVWWRILGHEKPPEVKRRA